MNHAAMHHAAITASLNYPSVTNGELPPVSRSHRHSLEPVSDGAWQRFSSPAVVDPLLRRAPKAHRHRCEAVLRGLNRRGFSQAWQDWILYRNFFAGQTNGLYLDIGTNDPLRISNSAFFDLCLGWRGVCFEPQERFHAAIRGNRSCALVPRCVLGQAANVSTAGTDGHFRVRGRRGNGGSEQMQCVGMAETLAGLDLRGRPIDLLTIDIEGSEPHVLSCMPFDELDIRAVLIETNKVDLRAVDAFFHQHGFVNYATLMQTDSTWLDNLYVKRSKLVVPEESEECSAEDRALTDCHGGGHWQPWALKPLSKEWGRCQIDQPRMTFAASVLWGVGVR